MSFQQDYILRLIENVGAMLRRILELAHLGRSGEALEEADQAVSMLVGVDASVADAMTVASLATFLRVGAELDVPRCMMLARVWGARAEALETDGRVEDASRQRVRAAELLRLASEYAVDTERDEIAALLGGLFSAGE